MKDHFEKILGGLHALDNKNDLQAYSYDGSGIEGKARIVLFPETNEQLRQIITYANRTNIPIIVRGMGTNPLGMTVPYNAIVIDMGKFDKILTINLAEEYIITQTGVLINEIQHVLKKYNYAFPVLPESAKIATIGGFLAVNQMDMNSFQNGRIDRYVQNIELFDGTGKYYDQGDKRFIGMEGIGALFTQVKIKIVPETSYASTSLLAFEQIHELVDTLERLQKEKNILCIEYINPFLSELFDFKTKHHLLLGYSTQEGEIKNQEIQDKLWNMRKECWKAASQQGFGILEDVLIPTAKLYEFITWVQEKNILLAGHAGMNIYHPFLKNEEEVQEVYSFVQSIGGEMCGQFGYGIKKKEYVSEKKKDLLIQLREEYDYNNIIGRGKLYDYV